MPGARDVESTEALVDEFRARTGGRIMRLMTSDSYPAYETAILGAYGDTVTPPRTGKPGRPVGASKVPPVDLMYATVEKRKAKGRVVAILTHVIFGTMAAVSTALKGSRMSRSINASFIERQNLTDRHHNARKSRKTYRFSKDWRFHEAATSFTMYSYNFCWPVRTLREPIGEGHWQKRTPAMAAGLTDHLWSISEWISFPTVLRGLGHDPLSRPGEIGDRSFVSIELIGYDLPIGLSHLGLPRLSRREDPAQPRAESYGSTPTSQ